MPPKIGSTWPSKEVPAPNATTGIFSAVQIFMTWDTSSVLFT